MSASVINLLRSASRLRRVSPGVVEGIVHVVLDPRGIQLAPGEILVCPGTDPAWTPLFMAAGGLVTEVGGMMTHGSVVAREYGIPAVVSVKDRATGRAKGFGFVEMATAEEAQKAISMLNGQDFMGRAITVNVARPPEDRPRSGDRNRGGGGRNRY